MPPLINYLEIAVPTPVYGCFDYLAPKNINLEPGIRVLVPFGRRKLIGIIVKTKEQSDFPHCKPVIKCLDDQPVLSPHLMQLCQFAAEYYHYPLGQVLQTALPTYLRGEKANTPITENCYHLSELGTKIHLSDLKRSPKQAKCIARLKQAPEGIKHSELKQLEISTQTLTAMQKKGWLEIKALPNFPKKHHSATKGPALNAEQTAAIATFTASKQFSVFLLNGVTGSGKTEVYIQAMQAIIKSGKQVLILVPEIGLTPQTIKRFDSRFSETTVALHSGLNDTERFNAWTHAKTGAANIIIGTRSAVFTPFKNLGLIIIDEEHDSSYKQQDNFRYHARDLSIMRAKFLDIPLILGSATPSLESYYNGQTKRFQEITLTKRAGNAIPPHLGVIDLRNKKINQGLSEPLIQTIKKHLNQKNQVLIFLNRRGFSPTLLCHDCGFIAHCKRCEKHLTYHQNAKQLRCHHCQHTEKAPTHCPECASEALIPVGKGTQRLEEALSHYFPDVNIARIDRDSTRKKDSLHQSLKKIEKGEHQLLIGTQMLAKGHHFPNVTLVAIIDVDGSLFSTDFRATERLGQLVMQVSGRAGRAEKPGEVLLQTHQPEHPLLKILLNEPYQYYLDFLLAERKQTELPPFTHLAIFRAQSNTLLKSMQFLQAVKKLFSNAINCLGPAPATMTKKAGKYRAELLMQADSRASLHAELNRAQTQIDSLESAKTVRWVLDVDPLE